MVIDPDTKKYVDEQMSNFHIKVSAFLSSMFNVLQEKGVVTPDDFDRILAKSKFLTMQTQAMGGVKSYIKEMEKIQKDLIEQAKDKSTWEDLK